MNKGAKIIMIGISLMMLVSSCTDNGSESPYADILNQPPFAALTDSIKKDRGNEGLYFRRAVLLNGNNLPEPALADFQKAWSLGKDERYALGISTLLLQKRPDSAILFLTEAIKELPKSMLLRLSLARAFDAQGKTDQALIACDQLLQQNPEQVDVLKLKAELLAKKGDPAGAVANLEKAYRLVPFDVELNYMLALKYAETGNERVLALCDSLIRADSLDVHAEPYYYKGIYYSNSRDKTKALTAFDEAVRHDYYFLDGYIEKAALLFEMKRYTEAIKTLNLALTISPQFADAYYWLGRCQEATGLKEEARLNYLKAVGLDKELIEAKRAADRLGN